MEAQTIQQIENLLRQAGAAHGVYEENELNGVYDQEWYMWYAAWILENGLNQLLGTAFQTTEFAQILVDLNEAHKQAVSGEDWAQFTARRLHEQYAH